ncbi:MAG: M16 family metallopeptidase [Armatimonadota bacterium]
MSRWAAIFVLITLCLPGWCLMPPVERMVLSNGVTVVSVTEPGARILSVQAFFKVGLWAEPSGQAGIRHLVARSLFGSSENQSSDDLAREIDRVGGAVYVNPAPDMIELGVNTVTDQFANASYLLCDAIKNPQFEPAVLESARTVCLADLDAEQNSQFRATFRLLRNLTMPDYSSYSRSLIGDRGFLQSATAQQCRSFAASQLTADRLVVVVVGNLPSAAVFKRLDTLLGEWRTKVSTPRPDPPALSPTRDVLSDVQDMPAATAYLGVGVSAPGMLSPDYPAAQVLSTLLGTGKSSRVFTELRTRAGMGYELGGFYPDLRDGSLIMLYLQTLTSMDDPNTGMPVMLVNEAKQQLVNQLKLLTTKPPTDGEVLRAKRMLIGNHALKHQRQRDRAYYLGWYEAVGLGCEYDRKYEGIINAVTPEQVRSLAKRLTPGYAVAVTMPK